MKQSLALHAALLAMISIIPPPWSAAYIVVATVLYSLFHSIPILYTIYQTGFTNGLRQLPVSLILRYTVAHLLGYLSAATNSCLFFITYFTLFEQNKAALQVAIVIHAVLIAFTSKFESMEKHNEYIRYALLITLHWAFIGLEIRPLLYVSGTGLFCGFAAVLLDIENSLSDWRLLYDLLKSWGVNSIISLLCAAQMSRWGLVLGKIYCTFRVVTAVYRSTSEVKRFIPNRYVCYALFYVIYLITELELSNFYYYIAVERPEYNCMYYIYCIPSYLLPFLNKRKRNGSVGGFGIRALFESAYKQQLF